MSQYRMTRLEQLLDAGFDRSREYSEDDGVSIDDDGCERIISVRCSRCEALVINGHATHERGCPNARRRDPETECEDDG
jgi:hypothetical protein